MATARAPQAVHAVRLPGTMSAWAVLLCAASAAVAASSDAAPALRSPALLLLVVAVVALDHVNIDLFGRGQISPGAVPVLALASFFGPLGPMAPEAVIALRRLIRRDPLVDCAADLGLLALSGAAAAATFSILSPSDEWTLIGASTVAGLIYYAVNAILLAATWGIRERVSALGAWRERFAWCWPHYLAFGVVAGMLILAEGALGLLVFPVFGLPIAMLWIAEKQYVERSRSGVAELRRSHAELRASHTDLEQANQSLRALLEENRELLARERRSYVSTITSLARTIEAKDPYTGGHTERVARVACLLAAEMGIDGNDLDAVEVGGVIHDIGKIGIPDAVLLKPARLSDEEYAEMRRHPEISSYIVSELELPPIVKQMARSHHERYDGAGYPDGLHGEEIPLAARILAVADTLDAMTTDRPYRRALTLNDAIDEIHAQTGIQFCPKVAVALHACLARDATLGEMFRYDAPRPARVVRIEQSSSGSSAPRAGRGAS